MLNPPTLLPRPLLPTSPHPRPTMPLLPPPPSTSKVEATAEATVTAMVTTTVTTTRYVSRPTTHEHCCKTRKTCANPAYLLFVAPFPSTEVEVVNTPSTGELFHATSYCEGYLALVTLPWSNECKSICAQTAFACGFRLGYWSRTTLLRVL